VSELLPMCDRSGTESTGGSTVLPSSSAAGSRSRHRSTYIYRCCLNNSLNCRHCCGSCGVKVIGLADHLAATITSEHYEKY
jgi:hypothetical protein